MSRALFGGLLACAIGPVATLCAHPGHDHPPASSTTQPVATQVDPSATTGAGDLRFRYRADLSSLPPEAEAKLVGAHGGFAKTPTGEIYFGLKGVGPIRISADLITKTVLETSPEVRDGNLHNAHFTTIDGQPRLVLPDDEQGQVHVLSTQGPEVARLGRPAAVNDYYRNASNPYKPTDVVRAPDGTLYVCDGYSPGKFVLTADLATHRYGELVFGGNAEGDSSAQGKFSTNHGITYDPATNQLAIADREFHRVQKFGPDGKYLGEFAVDGANPCDIDFVSWGDAPLMVIGCLNGPDGSPGVVHLLREERIVSTLRLKEELGIETFQHVHNAVGVVVDGKLFVLAYGWNPGCFAVLEHVTE